jgi:CBS domain-containing protein
MRRLEKTIEEIGWTRDVPRLGEGEVVASALSRMSPGAHDCVLVLREEKLAGIFTSRDFLNRVAAVRGDPNTLVLAQVMTPEPRALRPRDPIAFAVNWMAIEGFRNVPIVDDAGASLGVLTVWDVMRQLGELFDDIEAAPEVTPPMADTSDVVSLIDLGGGS